MFDCVECGTLGFKDVQFNEARTTTYAYNVTDWGDDFVELGAVIRYEDDSMEEEYWDCKRCFRWVTPLVDIPEFTYS